MEIRPIKKIKKIILTSNVNETSSPKIKLYKKNKQFNAKTIKIKITSITKRL